VVEHFLGKEEVKGSIPFNGSEFSGILKSIWYAIKLFEVLLGREKKVEE
jgi:hypothetical protein